MVAAVSRDGQHSAAESKCPRGSSKQQIEHADRMHCSAVIAKTIFLENRSSPKYFEDAWRQTACSHDSPSACP